MAILKSRLHVRPGLSDGTKYSRKTLRLLGSIIKDSRETLRLSGVFNLYAGGDG